MNMEDIVEQAGAVTFKKVDDSFEVLLVRSKKDPEKWIFPKGHIEIGESAIMASERELLEEAGVIGASIQKIGILRYSMNNRKYNITYFINRFISYNNPGESGRNPTWFKYKQAIDYLSFQDMKELLKTAVPKIQKYLN